jgi:hypothetical protein
MSILQPEPGIPVTGAFSLQESSMITSLQSNSMLVTDILCYNRFLDEGKQ